eukprot:216762-Amorphochlora_amoeboformis.AAC.1
MKMLTMHYGILTGYWGYHGIIPRHYRVILRMIGYSGIYYGILRGYYGIVSFVSCNVGLGPR